MILLQPLQTVSRLTHCTVYLMSTDLILNCEYVLCPGRPMDRVGREPIVPVPQKGRGREKRGVARLETSPPSLDTIGRHQKTALVAYTPFIPVHPVHPKPEATRPSHLETILGYQLHIPNFFTLCTVFLMKLLFSAREFHIYSVLYHRASPPLSWRN